MRPSKLATPLARLRDKINTPSPRLAQKEVAGWLGVSESHYRKIECGLAPLTLKHAEVINRKTGIGIATLLGFGGKTLQNDFGKVWTPRDFDEIRDRPRYVERQRVQSEFTHIVARVMAILLQARSQGEPQFYGTALKLKNALHQILADLNTTPKRQPVVDRIGVMGTLLVSRPTDTRPNLEPLLNKWENHFKKLKAVGKF